MKKYGPPVNCSISCKMAKITKKYVTIETAEIREGYSLPFYTSVQIAHNGKPEETAAEYNNLLRKDRKRGYDDFFPEGPLPGKATIANLFQDREK
jgi:hypothetical protein